MRSGLRGAAASCGAGAESRAAGLLPHGAEPSGEVTGRRGGPGSSARRGGARALPAPCSAHLPARRGGPAAAVPMGLCLPCLGEPEPPSPDPVSKAASARRRPRRAHLFAGRAPRGLAPRAAGRPGGWTRGRAPPSPRVGALGAGTCGRAPRDLAVLPAEPGPPPPRSPHLGYVKPPEGDSLVSFADFGKTGSCGSGRGRSGGRGPFVLGDAVDGVQMKFFFSELRR